MTLSTILKTPPLSVRVIKKSCQFVIRGIPWVFTPPPLVSDLAETRGDLGGGGEKIWKLWILAKNVRACGAKTTLLVFSDP